MRLTGDIKRLKGTPVAVADDILLSSLNIRRCMSFEALLWLGP